MFKTQISQTYQTHAHAHTHTHLLPWIRTHHSLFPEVDADCGDELGVELVVCVSVKEGGLPHAGVPQGKELYKVVIIPISHSDDRNKPVENKQHMLT